MASIDSVSAGSGLNLQGLFCSAPYPGLGPDYDDLLARTAARAVTTGAPVACDDGLL